MSGGISRVPCTSCFVFIPTVPAIGHTYVHMYVRMYMHIHVRIVYIIKCTYVLCGKNHC